MSYFYDDQRHLVCVPYGRVELHAMADALGINRCWFHAGRLAHYDVPLKAAETVAARATLVRPRDILEIIRGGRTCP